MKFKYRRTPDDTDPSKRWIARPILQVRLYYGPKHQDIRCLVDGGAEWRRWMQLPGKPIRVAPAVFVDQARAYRGLEGVSQAWQSDVGAGVRLAITGSGVFRIDIAHGLRDGRDALSVGWGR